jgi:hypothetical protein
MTFSEWFETDGREAVASSGLGASGATVRSICQRAFAAGERLAHRQARQTADAAAEVADRWVAHYYLLGVIPAGTLAVEPGRGRGEAWLDARLHVRRFFRPFIGIEVRS